MEEGGVYDPVVIISALLHDTVEDTDTTIEEIEREFGPEVKLVVSEVTDDKSLTKDERKRLQIEHAPHISREGKLVKLADKIYNLRDLRRCTPKDWTPARVHEYFKVCHYYIFIKFVFFKSNIYSFFVLIQWAKAVIEGCRGTNTQLEAILDKIFAEQLETCDY